ncbi:uncharacterized protein LOC125821778 [Solanum verrucosum]|uniref:uncharacterized protein LOC125821778 n=1 Tax=Solanum verrucosum TaxID=315347 RepID=UPI0020D0ADE2|nr:uncharacterized protein LOC125821778 [Solanum verrucosum]
MATIPVLIRHSGEWNEENSYVEYSIDGVLLKEHASFSDLVNLISGHLNVDMTTKCMKIKYTIEGDVLQLEYNVGSTDTSDTLYLVSSFGDNPNNVFDGGNDLIITNRYQKEIMEDQVYVDKSTLKSVMENYTLVCHNKECKWVMKASSINKSKMFRIRVFNSEHTCPLKDRVHSQVKASSGFIGGIIAPKLKNHKRKYTPNDIAVDMKLDLGVDINYQMAWRAKEKALDSIMGQPAASYKKLPGYLYTLDKTYPGSHIRMKKTPENEFLYLFISLHAFIKGFDYCRPIVVVDACHLKSAYTGAFVSASTLDGAGNILPLAYGVIDSENDASWTRFFEQFKEAYGERENMCVVSDRHESIIKAVSRVYTNMQHYACIWHLWANVCKNFRKSNEQLSEIFYAMAKAYTQNEFDRLMNKVEQVDIRVKNYLEFAGYEKWARLYAPVHRGWMMTSNIAESINSTLVAARELPIFDFLEQVRLMFARWNCKNRENASFTFTPLGKKFQEMLVLNTDKSIRMMVVPSTDYIYSVSDEGKNAYCSDFYKPKTVLKTYEVPVYPLPDVTEWNVPEHIVEEIVLPPRYKRPPGRPKKQRDKSFSELSKRKGTNSCSRCGNRGHNKRSCRAAPRNV